MNRLIYLIFLLVVLISNCKYNNSKTEKFVINGQELQFFIPDAPRWLLDLEQIFDKNESDSINKLCQLIYERTQHMVMIHTTEDFNTFNSLNEYALVLENAWSDASQKYIIIVISAKNQEIRLIYGSKTEHVIPDEFTQNLLEQIIFPNFRKENYFFGVIKSLEAYLTVLQS